MTTTPRAPKRRSGHGQNRQEALVSRRRPAYRRGMEIIMLLVLVGLVLGGATTGQ